jgi:putative flavoprotein involved in K+ transport
MRRNGLIVIVGAGPAGLAASSRLARAGSAHVVLERGRVGSSWRTQRWDSFRLNTPRWANRVPGKFLDGPRDSFVTAGDLVAAFERLAARLPVVEGAEVFSARRSEARWRVDTSRGPLLADAVVVASGFQSVPRRPGYASALPSEIAQLHAADYRRPGELGDGVLVVGGGQSGVQIAEDLLDAGKRVYVATSRVGRLPRRYRGRDAYEWLRDNGQLDLPRHEADPATIAATPPQVSGGRTLSTSLPVAQRCWGEPSVLTVTASSSRAISARTSASLTTHPPVFVRPGTSVRGWSTALRRRIRPTSPRRICTTRAARPCSTSAARASRR